VSMISIGGIIGSGLFVGSSAAIAATGPAIVVSYAIAGLLILLVMRMLADMALAAPGAGSFTEHIRMGLGPWAGFVSGWLYWIFWVLAIALEALAGANIIATWSPWPIWQIALALIVALTALNLLSTRAFGESEFWLSAIKVAAIILFIGVGAIAVGGGMLETGRLPANLYAHGGFAPFGPISLFSGVTAVILALVGAEIITIAAAEARAPGNVVARLTTTLIIRVALFYLLSMLLVVAIVPWNAIRPGDSPFALALDAVGAPRVSLMMNLVIIVAVLSCMNSGIYVCSRVLRSLAARGEAPRAFQAIGGRGVPVRSILVGAGAGALAVLASAYSPERLFAMLVNATGMVMLIVYMLLVLAHIAYVRRGGATPLPAFVAPMVLLAMTAVIVSMMATPALASQAYAGLGSTALLVMFYHVRARAGRADAPSAAM
ncbi:MAG TPA: amino acid permease, partial [Allosphingosinicella sp.]